MRLIFKIIPIIILSTILNYQGKGQQRTKQQLFNSIDTIIKNQMGKTFPSISLAVVIDGKVVYKQAYGYADKEKKIMATTSTFYQIGSLTKTFTGNLLAKFIINNKISLFDSLQKHFPSNVRFPLDSNGKGITFLSLATHTAAIPRYPGNLVRQDGDPILGFSKAQLYAGINAIKLSGKIGAAWNYSNFGYGIIGTALEMVSNRSLNDLFIEHIFSPLKMTHTSLIPANNIKASLAIPYRDDNPDIPTQPWDMGSLSAAGNIFSNVEDLSKFLIYQIEEIDAATKLQHHSFFQINESVGYGLGCFTGFSKSKNTRIIYHGGDVDGYAADYNFLPDKKMGVVILTNCGSGRAFSEISNKVFNTVFAFISNQHPDPKKK